MNYNKERKYTKISAKHLQITKIPKSITLLLKTSENRLCSTIESGSFRTLDDFYDLELT